MPSAAQDPDGTVTVSLGAKGVVELELVASGEKWGRGPKKDVHSSNRARLDSPAFHLVQALATLVTADGDPAIDGFADAARAVSAEERAMLDAAAARLDEATAKRMLSAERWAHDLPWRETLERFVSTPTVNIEGLVGGYTGPGGKTVLPHRAVAKLDLRLVPDMTFDGAVAALKAHLAKRGFGDIEVNPSGGYDPTSTAEDAAVIRAQLAGLPAGRARSHPVAAQRRLVPRLRLHRPAAEAARGPLRPRPRQRRARARRVLRDRVGEPEGGGLGRRGALVRRLPARAGRHRLNPISRSAAPPAGRRAPRARPETRRPGERRTPGSRARRRR